MNSTSGAVAGRSSFSPCSSPVALQATSPCRRGPPSACALEVWEAAADDRERFAVVRRVGRVAERLPAMVVTTYVRLREDLEQIAVDSASGSVHEWTICGAGASGPCRARGLDRDATPVWSGRSGHCTGRRCRLMCNVRVGGHGRVALRCRRRAPVRARVLAGDSFSPRRARAPSACARPGRAARRCPCAARRAQAPCRARRDRSAAALAAAHRAASRRPAAAR